MKLTMKAMCALSVTACLLAACDDKEATDLPPGQYEKSTSSTDAQGTTTEHETNIDVSKDAHGNKEADVETKTTKDPEGLFNSTTTEESHKEVKPAE